MRRTFLLGILAIVLAVGVWLVTQWFEIGAQNGLLGVGGGLVLGLIRDGSPLARYGAFLIGLIFGFVGSVADLIGGAGLLILILILTVISALTKGRLPLWAMILGTGVFGAMYSGWIDQSWFILTSYPSAFFLALATSSGGFIIAVFVELIYDAEEEHDVKKEEEREEAAEASADSDSGSTDADAATADSATGSTK